MAADLAFYFDFMSPYSYLAQSQIRPLAERTGAVLRYEPVPVRGLMERVGNRPTTMECQNKLAYAMQDMGRWAAHYAIPFAPGAKLRQTDAGLLLRGALAARDKDLIAPYTHLIFEALWGEGKDLSEPGLIAAVLDEAGLPGTRLVEEASDAARADELEKAADLAAEKGLFGTPSFLLGGTLYFGNDRLGFLEEALKRQAA